MISFAQPLWILAGIGSCLLLWFIWNYMEKKRRQQLQLFIAAPLVQVLTPNVSLHRRRLKKLLIFIAVFLCFIALARPQYGSRWVDVKHKGIDILFALDTSKSMLVEDARPNRLERSKLAIMDFVSQLNGDRVGLMPFAGSSFLMCPLTADYFAFEQSLTAVDTSIIPTGGTNIEQAILSAEKTLSNEANHKILVMITDGENLQGNALEAAAMANKQDMTIYAVGVGSGEGELIPDTLHGGFIKDSDGSFVKSRLDEDGLRTISETTGGFYVPLGNHGEGLETIYQQKLALIPKTELAEKRKKLPIDRFEWVVTLALLLLSIEFVLSGRKTDHQLSALLSRLRSRNAITSLKILPFLVGIFLTNAPMLNASEGERAYDNEEYLAAQQYYQALLDKDPNNPQLLYNNGTVAYKNNLLEQASESFAKALSSDDISLQEKTYYNLGNVYYRKGEDTLNNDPQKTIKEWEEALEYYQGALSLNPENDNATFNHDLVKSRLEQLKAQSQAEQQPENQGSENDQNKQGQQEQDQASRDQNQQSSQPGDSVENERENQPQHSQNADGQDFAPGDLTDQAKTETPEPEKSATPAEEGPDTDANATATAAAGKNGEAPNTMNAQSKKDGEMVDPNSVNPQKTGDEHTMTSKEAQQLLQALQDEEGRLNLYIPVQKINPDKIIKDW